MRKTPFSSNSRSSSPGQCVRRPASDLWLCGASAQNSAYQALLASQSSLFPSYLNYILPISGVLPLLAFCLISYYSAVSVTLANIRQKPWIGGIGLLMHLVAGSINVSSLVLIYVRLEVMKRSSSFKIYSNPGILTFLTVIHICLAMLDLRRCYKTRTLVKKKLEAQENDRKAAAAWQVTMKHPLTEPRTNFLFYLKAMRDLQRFFEREGRLQGGRTWSQLPYHPLDHPSTLINTHDVHKYQFDDQWSISHWGEEHVLQWLEYCTDVPDLDRGPKVLQEMNIILGELAQDDHQKEIRELQSKLCFASHCASVLGRPASPIKGPLSDEQLLLKLKARLATPAPPPVRRKKKKRRQQQPVPEQIRNRPLERSQTFNGFHEAAQAHDLSRTRSERVPKTFYDDDSGYGGSNYGSQVNLLS